MKRISIANKQHVVRFVIAGIMNTAVHIAVCTLLVRFISVVPANVLGFLAANIFSFFVASFFVFKVRTYFLSQYLHFLLVSCVGTAISFGVALVCAQFVMSSIIAPLLTAAIVAPISYLLQRSVFWKKHSAGCN